MYFQKKGNLYISNCLASIIKALLSLCCRCVLDIRSIYFLNVVYIEQLFYHKMLWNSYCHKSYFLAYKTHTYAGQEIKISSADKRVNTHIEIKRYTMNTSLPF